MKKTYPIKTEVGPFRLVQKLKDAPVQIFDPDGNNVATVAGFSKGRDWIENEYPNTQDD
jgi:hypothetical protein